MTHASLQREVAQRLMEAPDVATIASFVGVDAANNTMLHTGRMLVNLASARGGLDDVMARLRERGTRVPGVRLFFQPVQDLTIESETGPTLYRMSLEAADTATATQWAQRAVERLRQEPLLANVTTDAGATGAAVYVEVDRDTAARLNISAATVDEALYSAFGQRIVSTIFTETNQYRVILEARPDAAASPASLGMVQLRTASGEPTPLSAVATITERRAPLQITHVAQYPAATVGFDTAPGVALGTAVDAIRTVTAGLELPPTVSITDSGMTGTLGRTSDWSGSPVPVPTRRAGTGTRWAMRAALAPTQLKRASHPCDASLPAPDSSRRMRIQQRTRSASCSSSSAGGRSPTPSSSGSRSSQTPKPSAGGRVSWTSVRFSSASSSAAASRRV